MNIKFLQYIFTFKGRFAYTCKLQEDNKRLAKAYKTLTKNTQKQALEIKSMQKDFLSQQSIITKGGVKITMHAFLRFLERKKNKNVDKMIAETFKELNNNPSHFIVNEKNIVLTYIGNPSQGNNGK